MAGFATLRHATISGQFALSVQAEQVNADLMTTPTMQAVMGRVPLWQKAVRYGNGTASRLSLFPLRDAVMAATAEGTDPGATTFTPVNRDLATARNAILFSLGDDEVNRIPAGLEAIIPALNMSLDTQPNQAEMEALMALGVLGYYALTNRIAALVKAIQGSWGTYSFGATGTDPTFATISNARDAMVDGGNRGRLLWLLTRPQASHYRDDVTALGGAVQWHAAAQRMVDTGMSPIVPNIIDGVDAAVVPGLTVAVGDTVGGMFTQDGLTVKIETPPIQSGAELIGTIGPAEAPLATIERRRIAGSTSVLSIVSWIGVGIADDSAGSVGTFAT
jgi:hypothetical protein